MTLRRVSEVDEEPASIRSVPPPDGSTTAHCPAPTDRSVTRTDPVDETFDAAMPPHQGSTTINAHAPAGANRAHQRSAFLGQCTSDSRSRP